MNEEETPDNPNWVVFCSAIFKYVMEKQGLMKYQEVEMSSLNILIQYFAQSPSQCDKGRKRNKRINIGTEGIELSLFADAMMLYVKRKIYHLLCRNLASAVAPGFWQLWLKTPPNLDLEWKHVRLLTYYIRCSQLVEFDRIYLHWLL